MPFKLGKTPARAWGGGSRFRLAHYADASALPPLPAVFGHEALISSWPMFANDQWGDCVWAGAAHETTLLAKEAGNTVTFTDANVLSDYAAVTGFKIDDPTTDQGTDMQVAADYRRKTGIVDAQGSRHKIAACLALEPGNVAHLYLAAYLFGAVGVGLMLPSSALDQAARKQTWDVVAGSPREGGHYVPLLGRRAGGLLCTVSWGMLQMMTEEFFATFCDETVAYVSTECLIDQKSPEGFNYAALINDLDAL